MILAEPFRSFTDDKELLKSLELQIGSLFLQPVKIQINKKQLNKIGNILLFILASPYTH